MMANKAYEFGLLIEISITFVYVLVFIRGDFWTKYCYVLFRFGEMYLIREFTHIQASGFKEIFQKIIWFYKYFYIVNITIYYCILIIKVKYQYGYK